MAYKYPAKWRKDEIVLELIDDYCEGELTTIGAHVGAMRLMFMGLILEDGARLVVANVHVQSAGVSPNDIGLVNLRVLAQAIMEYANYDEIVIQGAVRTTGARPQHQPRPFRFARDRVDPGRSQPRGDQDD